MDGKWNGLEKWQLNHYKTVELVRLNHLLETRANEAGSIVELIKSAAQRFKAHKYKPFSSNDISGLKRNKTDNQPIKTSAITDRSIYRLALLLDVDEDLAWGGLILRLYLSGKIDNINQPTINAIKEVCQLQPKVDISLNVHQWLTEASPRQLKDVAISAITRLAEQEADKGLNAPKASLLKYIEAILEAESLALEDLTTNTAISAKTLEQLRTTDALRDYELESLASWLSDITGEAITSDTLIEVYGVNVSNRLAQ